MRSKIQDLGDMGFVRMAVVAPGGFGKTRFAGTAPDALFLTVDPEGTLSAKFAGSTAKEIIIRDQEDLINAQLDLFDGIQGNKIVLEGKRYRWLIVDDATAVQYIYMRTAIDNRIRRTLARGGTQKPGDALPEMEMANITALLEGEGNLNRYVPELNDRYTYQNAIIDFFKKISQLPINVIFVCKRAMSSYEVGEEGSDAYWTAAIEGQRGAVAEQCLGFCPIVASGEIIQRDKKEVRRFIFTHIGKHRGKDRTNTLGRVKDNLTVPLMMQIIENGATADAEVDDGEEVASTPARPRPRRRIQAQ